MSHTTNQHGPPDRWPKRIETERLLLRAMAVDDAEAVFTRYANDPQVTRYLSWLTHTSLGDTLQFVTEGLAEMRAAGGQVWVIEPLGGGPLIGAIGASMVRSFTVDIGYSLARDTWGQGYATEATIAVVNTALALPSIHRVQAMCDIEHAASARVIEKAGLQFEGTLRRYWRLPNRSDQPRDMLCFAKVRE